MERRTYAAFKRHLPEKRALVTSPQLAFEEYCSGSFTKTDVINILVGDTQRIKLYSEKGFQIPQKIPAEVWAAFERLVALGYTRHLIES